MTQIPIAEATALTAQMDCLAAALAGLLALIEQPTTGDEQNAAVERSYAALASIGQPTGGAR
jgi:hypothetical protein